MADLRPDTGVEHDPRSTTGTPRWVKVGGVIALALVLLVGVMLIIGGGSHGPARHLPSDDAGEAPPADAGTPSGGAGDHTPPARHAP